MRILTHKLTISMNADFINFCKQHQVIFHNENTFSVKNKEGLYLTAFNDGEIKFHATECGAWEKFYVLDDECEALIDFINDELKSSYKLLLGEGKLHLFSDGKLITPSFVPRASFKRGKWFAEYKTIMDKTRFQINKPLIYFCIYGKEEFYECFYLALRSLIEKGNYKGDILVKAENLDKVKGFCEQFNNHFIFSEFDKKLGMFNRYNLYEEGLGEYSSLIYFDSDILTLKDISDTLKLLQQAELCSFIDGDPSFEEIACHFNHEGTFRAHKWYGLEYITKEQFQYSKECYVLNSGLFAINDFEKLKPFLDKVIQYKLLEYRNGDQPAFNLALYNSNIDLKTLNHKDVLAFSHSIYESFKNIDKVLIHYNTSVGDLSKLELMKQTWAYIENN